ncbi:MAG: hypothetical protein GY796_04480 [Chloroflexi bacterium]|nr:hypothetical protein [Chloroflexota bacterium]
MIDTNNSGSGTPISKTESIPYPPIEARPPLPTGYVPDDDQLSRYAATQRFTRLYIYLPLGVLTAVVLIFVIYLLYLAIFPPDETTRIFLSGLADFILVIWLIPTVALFGLVMTAVIGGTIYYKYIMDESERPIAPGPPHGRIRTLLWRLDTLLIRLRPKLEKSTGIIARPVISLNVWLVYIETWLKHLKQIIIRR